VVKRLRNLELNKNTNKKISSLSSIYAVKLANIAVMR
jgi:hypothetical protein